MLPPETTSVIAAKFYILLLLFGLICLFWYGVSRFIIKIFWTRWCLAHEKYQHEWSIQTKLAFLHQASKWRGKLKFFKLPSLINWLDFQYRRILYEIQNRSNNSDSIHADIRIPVSDSVHNWRSSRKNGEND
jgi:hypothetical protein